MVSDAVDKPNAAEQTDEPVGRSTLASRWTALDRGWQALALGLGVVALHAVIQFVAAPF